MMLLEIANLLSEIAITVIGGACLLRCYLQYLKFNLSPHSGNPIGLYLMPLTNWLVMPLRKIIPSVGRIDSACIVGAYLVVLAKVFLIGLLLGTIPPIISLLIGSVLELIGLVLSILVVLIIANVVLSWVGRGSPTQYMLSEILNPMLVPIKRILPSMGPLDLSPLVLLVLIQIAQIVLSNIARALL
ncbi:YggT family protein [Polynucleobacter sp.]|uniref:YggT family protein n=1 Tax=Polynucleobacter sp. TaxID=2029855 RepID=UPI00273692A3|nr:YggT family protein [Polynucleobacter sp.]MDP3122210.1 YggT family protein [Polynucleobacter sp.]